MAWFFMAAGIRHNALKISAELDGSGVYLSGVRPILCKEPESDQGNNKDQKWQHFLKHFSFLQYLYGRL